MSELKTKNTLVLIVKDLKVLHGSGDEVVKQKLSFLLSSAIAVVGGVATHFKQKSIIFPETEEKCLLVRDP